MAPASFHREFNAVCVMDASGQLGSSLVRSLLQRGYTVHAAVQNYHGDLESLSGLDCDKMRLKIFKSDPFDYQSIIDALKGCNGLFYTFEPPLDHPTYDELMADVEVRAAHNVLEACAQIDTMDKVVFTSSATAVLWRDSVINHQTSLDERHWTDVKLCRKFKLWYALSKTLAEKTAWALAMDRGVNMVCVNPGLMMVPDLSVDNPYLKGTAEMYEDGVFVTVDLNFLVDAHIRIFEDISSYGRYLCFDRVINCNADAFKLAKMLTPQVQSYEEDTRMIKEWISNKKLTQLMVDFESGPNVD
ncbi:hypothetical protein LguiA_033978 [Lonicera macranthoides]